MLFQRALVKVAGQNLWLKVARDGQEAVEYLITCTGGLAGSRIPQALVLDLKMHGMDGFELIEWVRGQSNWQTTPIAVLTSSPLREERDRALQLGANAYFVKPSSHDELISIVEQITGLVG